MIGSLLRTARPKTVVVTALTQERALRALPILVDRAQQHRRVTYKELAAKIGTHPQHLGRLLRYIRDEICEPRGIPLISAIVVRTRSRLPGRGFLTEGADHLTVAEYRQAAQRCWDQVFEYPGWADVLEQLGLRPIQR